MSLFFRGTINNAPAYTMGVNVLHSVLARTITRRFLWSGRVPERKGNVLEVRLNLLALFPQVFLRWRR